MLTKQKVEDYLSSLTANGASPETVRAYRTDLRVALDYIGINAPDWPTLERASQQWLNLMRTQWAPKTLQRRLGTLRSWARWAGAPADFLASYKAPKPAPARPHPISEGIPGVVAMIRSSRNPRHRALCALTGLMGLRVAEAISVRPEHFDTATWTLTVRGKGDKTRVVPITPTAWGFIGRAHAAAVASGGPLVPLSNRGARKAISRHARNAKLGNHVASHDMRATFATAAYDKTKDLRAVQELLGHADAKTTQVYTQVSMASMRAAASVT
jgi:site-specific recombinase XerC